jgi:hypothetical protein
LKQGKFYSGRHSPEIGIVAQHVRGDSLALERRASDAGHSGVLGKQILNPISAEGVTSGAGKEDISRGSVAFPEPSPQGDHSFFA